MKKKYRIIEKYGSDSHGLPYKYYVLQRRVGGWLFPVWQYVHSSQDRLECECSQSAWENLDGLQ